jgi:hypothetical protein
MAGRDHFKSSYGSYSTQQRELERNRARRDAADAAEAAEEARTTEELPTGATPDAAATTAPDAEQPAASTTPTAS